MRQDTSEHGLWPHQSSLTLKEALDLADKLGGFLNGIAWDESANVASERGPFPEYEGSALKEQGMPPVRNSSVITIAPTGTISRIAGCSSGIEPHFAMAWWSNVLWQDHEGASSRLLDAPISITQSLEQALGSEQAVREVLEKIVEDPENAEKIMGDHGINSDVFRTSMRVSAEAHIKMQSIWQKHVTNSVSKTINLPNSATIQDVKDAYMLAWETGCKAVTVYRDGSKSMQVLETGSTKSSDKSDAIDLVKTPRKRPSSLTGITDRIRTGHGTMFVTINFDEEGNPFEVFANLGKSGGSDSAYLQAIARLASMSLRAGVEPDQIVDQLRGITDEPAWDGGTLVRSAPDAIAIALNRHISDNANNDDEFQEELSVPALMKIIEGTEFTVYEKDQYGDDERPEIQLAAIAEGMGVVRPLARLALPVQQQQLITGIDQ